MLPHFHAYFTACLDLLAKTSSNQSIKIILAIIHYLEFCVFSTRCFCHISCKVLLCEGVEQLNVVSIENWLSIQPPLFGSVLIQFKIHIFLFCEVCI